MWHPQRATAKLLLRVRAALQSTSSTAHTNAQGLSRQSCPHTQPLPQAAHARSIHGSTQSSNDATGADAPRILVTGAGGQIGGELVPYLRARVGVNNVVATDVKPLALQDAGPFAYCDVQDASSLARLVVEHRINYVVHLATLLSAVGEKHPARALAVNTTGIQNLLELSLRHRFRIYSPSTIAVFGRDTPRQQTPDSTVTAPSTMYGITKVHQELLGQYYHDRYGVDYRSLRYPGVISANSPPGGGTTDYAVDIFHGALKEGRYTCFLGPDTALPMMYMPDCLDATWQMMTAPGELLTRTTYNVTATSFTPAQLAEAIRAFMPGFEIVYKPDFRQAIADSWPASIDDSFARRDWQWQPKFDLHAMTRHMLETLDANLKAQQGSANLKAAVAAV